MSATGVKVYFIPYLYFIVTHLIVLNAAFVMMTFSGYIYSTAEKAL